MGPDTTAVGVDHVDQVCGEHLAAASHVPGTVLKVMIDKAGVEDHRCSSKAVSRNRPTGR